MPKAKLQITIKVPSQIEQKGEWWIARCDVFDVTTQGETKEKALVNMEDALFFFFESCIRRGTLFEILRDAGMAPASATEQPIPNSLGLVDRVKTALNRFVGPPNEPDESVEVSVPMAFIIAAGTHHDHAS